MLMLAPLIRLRRVRDSFGGPSRVGMPPAAPVHGLAVLGVVLRSDPPNPSHWPDDCTQPVLEEFFSHFGQVTSVSIPVGALGHATISFATAEEADRVFEDPETLVMSGQLLECKPCVGGKGQPRGRGSQGTSNGNWTSQEEQWGFEEGQGTSEGNWTSQEEQWGFEEGLCAAAPELNEGCAAAPTLGADGWEGQDTSEGNWTSQEEQWGFEEGLRAAAPELNEGCAAAPTFGADGWEGHGTSEGNWTSQEEQWGFEEGLRAAAPELNEGCAAAPTLGADGWEGQGTSEGNWTSQEEQWGFEEGLRAADPELNEGCAAAPTFGADGWEGQGTSEGNWASQEEQWGFEEGSGKPKSELPEQGGKSNVIGQSKGEPHRPREGPQDHTNSARRRWPPRGGKGREESARPKEGLAELTEPKLFVRRLPQATTEDELREYFESFGTVKDLALIYHPDTGAFRGYGFVSFEDLEAARAVLQNYDNNWFKNRWIDCQVKGAGAAGGRTETSRLLVEGVAQTLKEELREHLECFGAVKEMTFTGDGRCEVTFGLSGSAAAACAKASIVLNGEALRLSVMEEQRTRPDEGEGDEETTKMVFLQKVPEDWTSVEARQYFQKFGQVVELTLPFEADGERGALLTFDSCESSAKAIAFAKVGAPKPYFAGAAVKAEKEPPQEVFLHVRNVAPGRRLDTSDVFKIFGKYSLARIRDLEGEAMVEFASTGECIKAFEEQDGVRANGVQLALEGSTRDAFMEFRKRQERTWGGPRPPGR
ncbi:TAR DNA-binding protein 43 (TDP-43) [Durusdinium trenchii]|uniref:TAR DNA-binding protein 43 (TDP-43) n=1 Tax=Durusdinium trenchii TaxID=1381693 RepID=A0ABP0K2Q0_9DINO